MFDKDKLVCDKDVLREISFFLQIFFDRDGLDRMILTKIVLTDKL